MKHFIKMAGAASLLGICQGFGAAYAGDIYRWIDDQGVTQIGDTVPEAYKSRAKVIGSTESAVDPQQQKDAEARAARDAQRLKELQAATPAPPGKSASTAPPAAPVAPKPAAGASDCAALWAAYNASNACFSQYVTVNGHRESNCVSVPDPTVQCGTTMAPAQ
jgi:hypothetical protein